MNDMFGHCYNIIELDLSNFDTSKVTTMGAMFGNCKNLTELDVSNFNTANVTDIRFMFNNCNKLTTEITIKGSISSYGGMFSGASTTASSLITVNYTAETSELVDAMIATKSANSNVVKGSLVE